MRRIIWVSVLALAVGGPLHAAGPLDGKSVPGGIVQEQDVDLFFDFLRDAVAAAAEGRAVSPPEALTRRAEEIGEDMKQHGAAAARALIDRLESAVREEPRTPLRPLGTPAYRRI